MLTALARPAMNLRSASALAVISALSLVALLQACAPAAPPAQESMDQMIHEQLKTPSSFAIVSEGDGGGKMVINCQIDSLPELCMVDTGSENSQVLDNSPAIHQYPSAGKSTLSSLDGQARSQSDRIDVQNLSVLGFPVGNAVILRSDALSFPSYIAEEGIFGVIGNDVFSRYSLRFDFKKREIRFNEGIPDGLSQSQQDLNVVLGTHHVIMPLGVSGTTVNAIWDTGSFITLLNPSVVKDNPSQFTFLHDDSSEDATGNQITMKIYLAKSLTVGPLTFRNLIVGASTLERFDQPLGMPIRALIGYNAISQANWYLDFPNHHWAAQMN